MRLRISLFGDCFAALQGAGQKELRGVKHRALIALLATAPLGRRSRTFLQETLWGETCFDGGRQSLRRALSDLRKHFGSAFDDLFATDNSSVRLRLDRLEHMTTPADGELLEGIDVGVEGFEAWLRTERLQRQFTVARGEPASQSAIETNPRIAVIPFAPVNAGRTGHHLGDWFAEDISRALSRSHFLSVISHLSCRRLRNDRTVELDDVRDRLDVRYLLTGSIRHTASELGLDTDLVETATGRIIATRSFRGKLTDVQDLRCGITAEVSNMVSRSILVDMLRETPEETPVADIDTHRLLILGLGLMHQASSDRFHRAKECLDEIVQRAPHVPSLKAWLAKWHVMRVSKGWADDPREESKAARALTLAALNQHPECALSLTVDGLVLNNLNRDIDAAGARFRKALKINPNDSLAWLLKGMQYAFTDSPDIAVKCTERAHALSPLDPLGYFYDSLRASAYLAKEDYATSLKLVDRSIALNPRHLSTLRVRIASLHGLGRLAEAKRAARDLRRITPDFRVNDYRRSHPSSDYPVGERMAAALLAAGIPK